MGRNPLKPGTSHRTFWLDGRKKATADTARVSKEGEDPTHDWRIAFATVLDTLRNFPEARKAVDEALLRIAADRQTRR